jgi:hypothetical protein
MPKYFAFSQRIRAYTYFFPLCSVQLCKSKTYLILLKFNAMLKNGDIFKSEYVKTDTNK